MRITICDKCNKEIKISLDFLSWIRNGCHFNNVGKNYDLCKDCYKDFDKWLKR